MNKWPWQCSTTGLDNSTELRTKKSIKRLQRKGFRKFGRSPPGRPSAHPPRPWRQYPSSPEGWGVKKTQYIPLDMQINKWFQLTLNNACNYLYMLGLKLDPVSKGGPNSLFREVPLHYLFMFWTKKLKKTSYDIIMADCSHHRSMSLVDGHVTESCSTVVLYVCILGVQHPHQDWEGSTLDQINAIRLYGDKTRPDLKNSTNSVTYKGTQQCFATFGGRSTCQ